MAPGRTEPGSWRFGGWAEPAGASGGDEGAVLGWEGLPAGPGGGRVGRGRAVVDVVSGFGSGTQWARRVMWHSWPRPDGSGMVSCRGLEGRVA
jgi:hypothetical protein